MFERFTDRARKVFVQANAEAIRMNHEYIGTEHILLGLVHDNSSVVFRVLSATDVTYEKVAEEVTKLVRSGPPAVFIGKLPHTPRAKKVIELAIQSAKDTGCDYIGTEHLLLGVIGEHDGVAAQVLIKLGVTELKIRLALCSELGWALDQRFATGHDSKSAVYTASVTIAASQDTSNIANAVSAGPLQRISQVDAAIRSILQEVSHTQPVAVLSELLMLLESLDKVKTKIETSNVKK